MAEQEKTKKVDYRREQKALYTPGKNPVLVQVPKMAFIMVDGTGAPEGAAYQNGLAALYSLSFTIKMSKMGKQALKGYFEYAMMPLEGLWANVDFSPGAPGREAWEWTSMIRQPEFVDAGIFEWALAEARQKKPEVNYASARFAHFEEGLCVQLTHPGPFSTEGPNVQRLIDFAHQNGYEEDYTAGRRHHEIYMNDYRRTAPERLKTVLRLPVRKNSRQKEENRGGKLGNY